jgi:hypothetical protein
MLMSAVIREESYGYEYQREVASRRRHVVPVSEGALFCENPACVLHVRAQRFGVVGAGEWATRPDGIVTSRGRYGSRVLCDLCGRDGRWAAEVDA